mmetsp:Transcript_1748/g.3275  ORF Transcript_1748/g.3275 Transcript_1748/m.3275 type:complete len:83 (-) Transcript_1748:74-322(-)
MIYIGCVLSLHRISQMRRMIQNPYFDSNVRGSSSLVRNFGTLSMNAGAAFSVSYNFAMKTLGGFPIWCLSAGMTTTPLFKAR